MPARYTWDCTPASDAVIDFDIQKSTDNGNTFATVATILADTTDPLVYDADADKFFWVDATPVAKEIVRIAARNAVGLSTYRYLYPPPVQPSLVNVFGAVLNPHNGRPMKEVEVIIYAMQGQASAYQENDGVASLNAESVTVAARRYRVFTDAEGRWSVDLMRDVPMDIEIPFVGVTRTFRLPKDETIQAVNFRDLVKYRIAGPIFQGPGTKGQRAGVADGPLGVGAHLP